jgi:hypothetical protein
MFLILAVADVALILVHRFFRSLKPQYQGLRRARSVSRLSRVLKKLAAADSPHVDSLLPVMVKLLRVR